MPANDDGLAPLPVTFRVKDDEVAVPPLSLMTILVTINFGWISLFVIVQVLVSPAATVPPQSVEKDAA